VLQIVTVVAVKMIVQLLASEVKVPTEVMAVLGQRMPPVMVLMLVLALMLAPMTALVLAIEAAVFAMVVLYAVMVDVMVALLVVT
jgi:hypothetical protein